MAAAAIVDDICWGGVQLLLLPRTAQARPGRRLPLPVGTEWARKGKTLAETALVPVRLTLVAREDIDANTSGLPVWCRREVRLRRLAHEAYVHSGVLSELDLSVFTGYSEGGVSSAAVLRMRARGEIFPLRGYMADMGSWLTHQGPPISSGSTCRA